MYNTTDFLERYKELERWAERQYGDDNVQYIEHYHYDKSVRQDMRYFRIVRNVLVHNPNEEEHPLITLTDEFKERFESLCSKLTMGVLQKAIPTKEIYKREMSDKVLPTIATMKEKSFSYIPVMNGKKVWGVFSDAVIFNMVSDGNTSPISENLPFYKLGKYITEYSLNGVLGFINEDATVDTVRRMFFEAANEGQRLDVLYITTSGDKNGDLLGMITVWDIPTL